MRRYFSKLVVIFSLLFFVNISTAKIYAASQHSFNKIVFFGDSLSDNGNLYYYIWGFIPKSPPYFSGMFSNGNVWSEYVGKHYETTDYMSYTNHAVGGQTAILHDPRDGYLPMSITFSLDSYLFRSMLRDRSKTLFIIWIGANDYLRGATDPDDLTNKVVNNIREVIESLIYHGGKQFLIFNLPDMSKTPYGRADERSKMLHGLTVSHNKKLAQAVEVIKASYKQININLFDSKVLFDQFVTGSVPEVNNKKMNATNSCWQGKANIRVTSEKIEAELLTLKKHALFSPKGDNKNIDEKNMGRYITETPMLLEAYRVNESQRYGGKACGNPDDYVFWDGVHPTGIVHKLLSQRLINYIDQHYHS